MFAVVGIEDSLWDSEVCWDSPWDKIQWDRALSSGFEELPLPSRDLEPQEMPQEMESNPVIEQGS